METDARKIDPYAHKAATENTSSNTLTFGIHVLSSPDIRYFQEA